VRNSFGFHGDIGALPAAGLSDFGLLTIPAATTTWSVNSTARMGAGWNGPYAALVKPDDDISRDGWGGAFSFSRATSPAYLVSYGADGVAGGTGFNQDITFSIPSDLLLATVTGFVKSAGAPFSLTADVELNIPNGTGAITQSVAHVLASDKGAFTMTSVPQGVRTIKVYYPSKASASWILGPQAITVDRPNSVVPSELLDLQNGTPP
jgi:hypothetical protein